MKNFGKRWKIKMFDNMSSSNIITEEELQEVIEKTIRNMDPHNINWKWAAHKGPLSESFIREFADFILLNDWEDILTWKSISKDFEREFEDRLPDDEEEEDFFY